MNDGTVGGGGGQLNKGWKNSILETLTDMPDRFDIAEVVE